MFSSSVGEADFEEYRALAVPPASVDYRAPRFHGLRLSGEGNVILDGRSCDPPRTHGTAIPGLTDGQGRLQNSPKER